MGVGLCGDHEIDLLYQPNESKNVLDEKFSDWNINFSVSVPNAGVRNNRY
jgi:hypothetical protein